MQTYTDNELALVVKKMLSEDKSTISDIQELKLEINLMKGIMQGYERRLEEFKDGILDLLEIVKLLREKLQENEESKEIKMDTQSTDGFLAKKEAAAYLSLSPRTIDNLVARGDLPAFKVTRKVLFRRRDLDLLAERHRIRSPSDVREEIKKII